MKRRLNLQRVTDVCQRQIVRFAEQPLTRHFPMDVYELGPAPEGIFELCLSGWTNGGRRGIGSARRKRVVGLRFNRFDIGQFLLQRISFNSILLCNYKLNVNLSAKIIHFLITFALIEQSSIGFGSKSKWNVRCFSFSVGTHCDHNEFCLEKRLLILFGTERYFHWRIADPWNKAWKIRVKLAEI